MDQKDSSAEITTLPGSPKFTTGQLPDGSRRSSRTKSCVHRFEDEDFVVSPGKEVPLPPPRVARSSRPKRKAAAAAADLDVTEDGAVLLEQIVAHVTAGERSEYKGWVELESEPGFFDAMLYLLGTQDFKVHELFGVDEFALELLPTPVHGLIYLYQYNNNSVTTGDLQECPSDLWFANQTTTNSCATVAMMNIVMNAEHAKLEPDLQTFKEATMVLPPPHRGHMLDKNDFIRSIHNSVARRSALVSEDLLLDNKFEAAEQKNRAQSRKRAARPSRVRKRIDTEHTFHYIAYVAVKGQAWELDGFESQPRCLGPCGIDDWIGVASTAIRQRMSANEDLSCSLLAICQSPLRKILDQLGTSCGADDDGKRSRLTAEHAAEMASCKEGLEIMRERQKDYTPAVHQWVQILAEKGVLRELIVETSGC